MEDAPVPVVVVADHPAVRAWLGRAVGRHPGLVLRGSAATLEEAVTMVDQRRPEVVVLDDHLGRVVGLLACRRLRASHPAPAVLFLSSLDDDDTALLRVLSGAAGTVLRGEHPDDVAARVLASSRPGPDRAQDPALRGLLGRLARTRADGPEPSAPGLLSLLVQGCTDEEIARSLHLSRAQVEDAVLDLVDDLRLGAASRTWPSPAGAVAR